MYQKINREQKNSKSLLIIIIIVFTLVAIIGSTCFILKHENNNIKENNDYKKEKEEKNSSSSKEENKKEEPTLPQEKPTQTTYSNIEQLSYSSFNDMIKNKRSFVVVISQTFCSHCIAYKPIYNEVLSKHNAKGYDLDIVELEEEQRKDILNSLNVSGTPTTLIYIDGVLQNERKEGIVEKEKLEDFLAMYGFIQK